MCSRQDLSQLDLHARGQKWAAAPPPINPTYFMQEYYLCSNLIKHIIQKYASEEPKSEWMMAQD